jgi:predicted nicotinamide N-methyase
VSRKESLSYGVRAFKSRHVEIKRLKRLHAPSRFGFRAWASSWLLMDFFSRLGLESGARVMDIGCGWGLAGIYCAKRHDAVVTGIDIDPEVFPYLLLHARINKVKIKTMNTAFQKLTSQQLENTDMLIGADICFWDGLVDPLKHFICRALAEGVRTVVIADPGRHSFYDLASYFAAQGEVLSWTAERPGPVRGKILRITSQEPKKSTVPGLVDPL